MFSKTMVIGVGATAALGLGIYGIVQFRRYLHRYDHLEVPQEGAGAMVKTYKIPGTDYWTPVKEMIDQMENIYEFEVYEDDVFIEVYPKAGTTWTLEIVWLVCNDADTRTATEVNQMDRTCWLEVPFSMMKNAAQRPRCIRTHVPLSLLPRKYHKIKPKTVYTTRNPKDTLVSMHYFLKLVKYTGKHLPFSAIVEQQINQVGHGSFWEHVLDFWKLRNEPHILFLKYEDMKEDLPREIRKIAKFLNKTLTEEQVKRIAEHCTFKSMKNNPGTNFEIMRDMGLLRKDGSFMRKGKVGNWKTHLSVEQNERIDKLTADWLESAGLVYKYQ